ncbi:hypothetical protein F503_01856 [Ophiostoma piceae UAMH 11346]|uniref:Secreted protein n=1 Tax=Ophiostoma piceae (strain UAMH 11346) TaxID=1262450 RepID=S3CBG3_OPHP1|nr:hypothetical protein F503_01856 [Ophiostoma piceae UAMH 11346]
MRYFVPSLALVAVAAATDVKIAWRHDVDSEETSLGVFDAATNTLLADTCGSILHTDVPIDFTNVHINGTADLWTIGSQAHGIHSNPTNGDPICTTKYNPQFTLVECTGVKWNTTHIPESLVTEKDCFSDAYMNHHFRRMEGRMGKRSEIMPHTEIERSENPAEVLKRQTGPGFCLSHGESHRIGDGSPKQYYFYKQLSETLKCGDGDCSVTESDSKSYNIGWTVTGMGLGNMGWLSGGFSVTKTWTTGSAYGCSAGAGESVCNWYNTAHTGYNVQYETYDCSGKVDGSYKGIMKSPNESNRGGYNYCVRGPCRSQGDNYWEDGPDGTAQ